MFESEQAIEWAETLDSIGGEECAAIIRDATISGELNEHWMRLGWIGGLREGGGERGQLRRQLAETAALGAAIKSGAKSIERMGMGRIAWAGTWQFDYRGAAADGIAALES